MTPCADCRELIGGYVLGALEPAEAETVRRHLEECESCRREHAALERIPTLLDIAASTEAATETPPARLEEKVLDRYAHRGGGSGRSRQGATGWRRALFGRAGLAIGGGLAGAAATVLLLVLFGPLGGATEGPDEVRLAGSALAPGASAVARLESRAEGTEVHLQAEGLPPVRQGVYELWFVRGRDRVSAGTFRVDADGDADTELTTAARPADYERVGVTREPDADDPARNGANVLAGSLAQRSF